MKRTLELLSGKEVKDQDIYMPASGLRGHPAGIDALFNWMVENWDDLYKRLPPALSMLGSMVSIMTSSFSRPEQIARVQEFFADKDTKGYNQALAQSLDAIRSKIAWIERDGDDIAKWLRENGYSK